MMRDVALKFPDLCAKTPMCTHTLLTSTLQVLAFDVSEGTKALMPNPRAPGATTQSKAIVGRAGIEDSDNAASEPTADAESPDGSVVDVVGAVVKASPQLVEATPLIITEAFPATIEGLEETRLKCRYIMNRIIQEIDNIVIKPEIANDEKRPLPYQSPFLFKLLIPLGVQVTAASTKAGQAVAAAKIDPTLWLASSCVQRLESFHRNQDLFVDEKCTINAILRATGFKSADKEDTSDRRSRIYNDNLNNYCAGGMAMVRS
ncbi:hypothetical protein TWF718_008563 [Orbilia javanica]|uniref:Uncharacterized protein n=1 Tax=Orbilia javanica TaxID=47235 RepID=A0AAN8RGB5_9PEZI